MEKGIKNLEEFKTTALTELDTVSNYLALDFFPTYNHQKLKSEGLRTAILKDDRDNEPKNVLQYRHLLR